MNYGMSVIVSYSLKYYLFVDAAKTDVQSEASADLPHVLKSGNTPVEYSSGIYEDTKQAEDFEIQYAQQSTSQSDLLLQNDNFYSASPQSEDSSITLSHRPNLCDKSQISETRTDNLSNKSPRRNNQIETPYSVASQRDLRPTTNSLHQSQRFYSSTSTLVSHDHSSQSKDLFASADDWELDVKQASEDTLSEKPYDLLASQDLIPSPQLASQGQALSSQGQALSSQNTEDLISSGSISGSQRLRIFEQELKQISKKSGTGSAIDFC